MRVSALLASSAAMIAGIAEPAAAQQQGGEDPPAAAATQPSRTASYDASFFVPYAPRSALDIARRVPGFSLDLGDTEIRGFAAAAGNVVINGARPSSKSETLEATLARIPSNRVVRVEVGPGDLYGSDYSSKSQVLNIIMSTQAGFDGNITAAAQRLWTGRITPNLTGSALIKRGSSSINLSASTGNNRFVEEGTDTLVTPDGSEQLEFRRKVNRWNQKDPYVSASWALERAKDDAFRVNARWGPSTFRLTQANHVVPSEGPERDDRLVQDFKFPAFEIGGDVTRPLAGGALKFVGLANRRRRDRTETYFLRNEGGSEILGGFESIDEAKRGETIGRLTWSRDNVLGLSFETGAEVAYNTLDAALEVVEFEAGGERVPIDLPIENATAKELRGEIYVKGGKQLSKALRLDAGLNYELSRLKVRGDAQADRTLKFLKPTLTLDIQSGGKWHAQLIARRTVAQLDFYDFISAAELSAGRVNAGNADLRPQRSWELRAVVERPILGEGQARLEVGYDRISELQDRILIFDNLGQGFDAPGNLGTGKRRFATLTVDAPLSQLWKGFRARFTGTLQKTRVDDPIWGDPREFSGFFPSWQWEIDLRRDAGKWAYGVTVQDRDKFTFFRTDELDSNANRGQFGTGFVEYRPSARTALTLDVDNLFNSGAERTRVFFRPNRTVRTPTSSEVRERNYHPRITLTLKRSFGGAGASSPAP